METDAETGMTTVGASPHGLFSSRRMRFAPVILSSTEKCIIPPHSLPRVKLHRCPKRGSARSRRLRNSPPSPAVRQDPSSPQQAASGFEHVFDYSLNWDKCFTGDHSGRTIESRSGVPQTTIRVHDKAEGWYS